MKLIMESWKKFTESLNEQEQKTSDVQKSEPKPSSAKKFKYEEIFPDSKVTHFNNLHEKSGIPFKKMIFFDDESRNIKEVGNLGVRCHLLNEGINLKEFRLLFHS